MRLYYIFLGTIAVLLSATGIYATVQEELLPFTCALAVSVFLMLVGWYRQIRLTRKSQQAHNDLQEAFERYKEEAEAARLATVQESEERKRAEMLQFRRDLSHSVRVPLSIVQGYAELLSSNIVLDENLKREYLSKIILRSKFIGATLEQQMSAARSEEDISLTKVPLDFLQLIRQSANDFQTSATFRGVTLQFLSQQETVMVLGDAFQLTRVFYNIVENSTKYMGRDGIVTIRVFTSGSGAHLIIKDDGMGLSEEETLHIFEQNYQGSNKAGGHGHGLTLAKKIIVAHGGTIQASSSLGMGMQTEIHLPLLKPSAEATD